MDVSMYVSPVQRSQFSSDFDETWHTYSLIFNLDFVESFFDRRGNKGEVCPSHSFQRILIIFRRDVK